MSDTSQTPTPAREWNRAKVYKLPSGIQVTLRRPTVLSLVGKGVGNPISDAALLQLHAVRPAAATTEEERLANIHRNSKMYLEVAALAMVEPRLVLEREPDYDAGEIGPDDIDDRDLMWLGQEFIRGDADELAAFRVG